MKDLITFFVTTGRMFLVGWFIVLTGIMLFTIPLVILIVLSAAMPWLIIVIGAIMFITGGIIAFSEDIY